MSTQDTAALIQSVNNMTGTVSEKVREIDEKISETTNGFENKISQAKNDFDQWRGGVQAADINAQPLYIQTIDLTGLSTDYFYPVWWRMPSDDHGISTVSVTRVYRADEVLNPFGDGDAHVAGLNMELEGSGIPWGGGANFLTIKRLSQTYRLTVRQVRFGMMSIARYASGSKNLYGGYKDGQIVDCAERSGMYLRGGLTYRVAKNFHSSFEYSRESDEVAMLDDVGPGWEIRWKVKPYHKDDPLLGLEYDKFILAYQYDYDKRFVSKDAFSAQTALLESDIADLQKEIDALEANESAQSTTSKTE